MLTERSDNITGQLVLIVDQHYSGDAGRYRYTSLVLCGVHYMVSEILFKK